MDYPPAPFAFAPCQFFFVSSFHPNRPFFRLAPFALCCSPVAYCPLPIDHYLLTIAYCSLTIAYCSLTIAYCSLTIAYCSLTIAYCSLTIAHYFTSHTPRTIKAVPIKRVTVKLSCKMAQLNKAVING
ncbi:MAG: hypothetical protein FJ117_11140 [Deltaproteobacteria bacterium]|nr:hypothetical protein [Deltaproteobacteria bacterium]